MSKYIVAVLIVLSLAVTVRGEDHSGFSFKTGLGYDFLSQRYFLDSLQHVGSDSVLTRWALTTDYLDDFKGSLDFHFLYDEARRLEFRTTYEQTPDVFRVKFAGDWEEEMIFGNLRWRTEVDWRDQYRDSKRKIGSYLYGSSQARLKYPLTLSTDVWGQLQMDGVNFYDTRMIGFDNYRYGGKFGLEQSLGIFSTATLDAFAMSRNVSDTDRLDYRSWGLEGSYLAAFDRQDLDLMARFEHKNYLRPDKDEDYDRVDFDGRSRLEAGENFVSRQELRAEVAWFDQTDLLNLSYYRLGGMILGGTQYGGLEIGIGPEFEVLNEQSADSALLVATDSMANYRALDSLQQDYYEVGGRMELTYFSGKGAFGSVDSELGYRHLAFQNPIQSNFVYYRLNVILDWTLLGAINLNALLSSEWEWHREHRSDSRVVLVSSGLTYSF